MKNPPASQKGRIKGFVERIAASCGIKEDATPRFKETTKTIVPKKVLTIVGNNEPDEYEVTDIDGKTWSFSNVVQKSGEKLKTCLHQPLELHFDTRGEIVMVIHQEYEIEQAHQ